MQITVKHNPLTTRSNGSADSNPLQMAAARGKWRQWEDPISCKNEGHVFSQKVKN